MKKNIYVPQRATVSAIEEIKKLAPRSNNIKINSKAIEKGEFESSISLNIKGKKLFVKKTGGSVKKSLYKAYEAIIRSILKANKKRNSFKIVKPEFI